MQPHKIYMLTGFITSIVAHPCEYMDFPPIKLGTFKYIKFNY